MLQYLCICRTVFRQLEEVGERPGELTQRHEEEWQENEETITETERKKDEGDTQENTDTEPTEDQHQ